MYEYALRVPTLQGQHWHFHPPQHYYSVSMRKLSLAVDKFFLSFWVGFFLALSLASLNFLPA